MPSANLIFRRTFDGAGYPDFAIEWGGFDFTPSGTINKAGWSRPVVNGYGMGMPSRTIGGVTWRARATTMPGTSDYQVDLRGLWKNPAGDGRREVGIIVRMLDVDNCVVARLRSMGAASPELRLFKIIGGTETQLGSTYTGVSAGAMATSTKWRVRVQDLPSGDTRVTVYTDPTGATGKGTSRITWTGDLGDLRGAHGVGIELRDQVYGTDVTVDDLEVYDLADEWNPGGGIGDASGWVVVADDTAYSTRDLANLSTTETALEIAVRQAYGFKGNRCTVTFGGDFVMGALFKPGMRLKVLHNGVIRFDGVIEDGDLTGELSEGKSWQAYDGYFAASKVHLRRPDGTSAYWWNVSDPEADEYDQGRLETTVGAALRELFDEYLDGPEGLRFYGAAPATELPYVTTELDALDAVIPDLSVSGTFTDAVQALLKAMPLYQPWWDPATRIWHFRNVSAVPEKSVALTSERIRLRVKPDRDRAYGAVEIRGTKKPKKAPVTYSFKDGTLPKAWTAAQEAASKKDKRHLGSFTGKVVSSGTGTAPDGVTRPYFDVDVTFEIAEDDWRGAVVPYVGSDSNARWVVHNTGAGRFWLSSPAWAPAPSPGDGFQVSLIDPRAVPALSAMGVGRAFFMPIAAVCGYPSAYGAGFRYNGMCGSAWVTGAGDNGEPVAQEYLYRVHAMTMQQQAALGCNPLVVLAEKPKIPLGLINKLPPPGGSPPTSSCVVGNTNAASKMPQVNVEIKVSELEDEAIVVREPETGYEGAAYTDWRGDKVFVQEMPELDSEDQVAGVRKAARAMLDLVKEKPVLLEVTIATPWSVVTGDYPTAGRTDTWAGLDARVVVTSTRRTTGLEVGPYPIFGVTWRVAANTTTLEAGTGAGWLSPEFTAIAKLYSESKALKKVLTVVSDLENYRNAMIGKNQDRVGGVQGGQLDGCEVTVVNENTHRVKNVSEDDQAKQAWINHQAIGAKVLDDLFAGVRHDVNPGRRIEVPGLDGAAAQQVQDGGPVLGPHASHLVPFQGPSIQKNGARGRYGGLIETDRALSGMPPRELFRLGGYSFRKALTADGRHGGAAAAEVAPLDAHGAPTSYVPFTGPTSLPALGKTPLKAVLDGSVSQQLLARTAELARQLGAVEDTTRALVAAGAVTTKYPHGAPASWADIARAGGGLLGPYFRPVRSTFNDPGGVVFEGPMTPEGANAGLFWRVMVPDLIPVRVSSVPRGTGTNGGSWSWYAGGPGGSAEYMTSGYVVHKQAHPADLSADTRQPTAAVPAAPDDACGFSASAGMVLPATGKSGAGAAISLPPNARGTFAVVAHFHEDVAGPAETNVGRTFGLAVYIETRASPWAGGTTSATTAQGASDGANTGTGIFKTPGGSVPAGLRKPFDASISIIRDPVHATDNSAADMVLTGLDVEVAVVEGGYLVRWRETVEATDEVIHSSPAVEEGLVCEEDWTLHPTLVDAEALAMGESIWLERSAPIQVLEGLEVTEEWELIPS